MLTLQDIEQVNFNEKRVTLAQLADFINANMPQYNARMEEWWGSFDRQIGRLRSPGKMIQCKVLRVYPKSGNTWQAVLDHNPREAYRRNSDVAYWILQEMKKTASAA